MKYYGLSILGDDDGSDLDFALCVMENLYHEPEKAAKIRESRIPESELFAIVQSLKPYITVYNRPIIPHLAKIA